MLNAGTFPANTEISAMSSGFQLVPSSRSESWNFDESLSSARKYPSSNRTCATWPCSADPSVVLTSTSALVASVRQ
jgi:hypothetical protein